MFKGLNRLIHASSWLPWFQAQQTDAYFTKNLQHEQVCSKQVWKETKWTCQPCSKEDNSKAARLPTVNLSLIGHPARSHSRSTSVLKTPTSFSRCRRVLSVIQRTVWLLGSTSESWIVKESSWPSFAYIGLMNFSSWIKEMVTTVRKLESSMTMQQTR